VRGVAQAVQFVDEADVVAAFVAAGLSVATGACNVATVDWLDAAALAQLSGGRVLALPRRALLGLSEMGRRSHLLPFGADRAVLVAGPLALGVQRAERALGWRPQRTSAEVLSRALGRASSCGLPLGLAS
jgi:nucleoside-diphosphate-sugar epimerase